MRRFKSRARPGWLLVPLAALACAAARSEDPLYAPAPGSPLALSGAPTAVEPGDLDRDGHLDLLVVCSEPVGLRILRGDGKGGFAQEEPMALDFPAAPSELVLADLDADGWLDAAAAAHDSHEVLVLFGDGRGGLGPAARFPSGAQGQPHGHGLLAHDVSGDGRLDLLFVQSRPENRLHVLRNDGRRGFTPAPELGRGLGRGAYPSLLADVDGDGRADLVSPGMESEPPELSILRGRAGGGFEDARAVPLAIARPYHVAAADLDGDRDLDLVVTHDDSSEASLLANDGGSFSPLPISPFDLGSRAWKVVAADLDGDGRTDLAAAGGSSVKVFLSDGRGGFAPAPRSPFPATRGSWRLAMADLDGNGRPDLVTCGVEAREIAVLLHR